MKLCRKCNKTKPFLCFFKRSDGPGFRFSCKVCHGKRPSQRKVPIKTPEEKKANAMPAWLSDNDKAHIKAYYETAKTLSLHLGIQMDVDHIVPLRGKEVCGLHVPWNLQVLEHNANVSKNNRLVSA